MERRGFLSTLAVGVAGALSGCGTSSKDATKAPGNVETPKALETPSTTASPTVPRLFSAPKLVRVPVPQGTLTILPGKGNLVALTVDDGTNTAVLKAYLELAQRTGLRLTFFANGTAPSWTEHASMLRPLVEDGSAIVCNHTWSHPNLNRLSHSAVVHEIQRNEKFLTNTYGVNGRPFLRPPYGYHNRTTDRILVELGYPAVTMWWGSFGDASPLPPQAVLANAKEWLLPQRLVIGHANHPGVISVMDQIVDIIRARKLQPVHLADIYDVTKLPGASPSSGTSTPG